MNREEISVYIENYYNEKTPELNMTPKIVERITSALANSFGQELNMSNAECIDRIGVMLNSEEYINFINKRQPYLASVSDSEKKAIAEYFNSELPRYLPVLVCRMSNHPDDSHIYGIIARSEDTYACWTSWNASRNVLNYGHYSLSSERDAMDILREKFHDISGDTEKYGVNATITDLSAYTKREDVISYSEMQGIADQKEKEVEKVNPVIIGRKHGR